MLSDSLWNLYLSEKIGDLILYSNMLGAFFLVCAAIYLYRKESGMTSFCAVSGLFLVSIAAFTPKEKFIGQVVEKVACEQILKTEIARTLKEVPLVVDRRLREEIPKIPKQVGDQLEGAVRKEMKDLAGNCAEGIWDKF